MNQFFDAYLVNRKLDKIYGKQPEYKQQLDVCGSVSMYEALW